MVKLPTDAASARVRVDQPCLAMQSAGDAVAEQRKMWRFEARPTNLRGIPVGMFAMNRT
jgi:hypothetical protein